MKLRIKVPATSANIGSGFDTIGMAVSLYNYFVFEPYGEEHSSLISKALHETFRYKGVKPVPCAIYSESFIPSSRGLGSSATCIVAGIAAAGVIMGRNLSKGEMFDIATKLEGHPDNVAPAIFGGIQVSSVLNGKPCHWRISYSGAWDFVALIPEKELSTKNSRAVLPEMIQRQSAVENISNFGALIGALQTGDEKLLRTGLEDNLHQPYRLPLIPQADEVISKAKDMGAIGIYLSGAGSTLMAVLKSGEGEDFSLKWKKEKWTARFLKISEEGFEVRED